MNREFLQLAEPYRDTRDNIAGYYISAKLDGGRAFWDGGLTRGQPTVEVPWANITNPKTGERKVKIKEATGLWSRYGNPIAAPEWFLNQLPACPLDGELFAGNGKFQLCMSVIRKDIPVDREWKAISYAVYGSPPFKQLFMSGRINNANFKREIDVDVCRNYVEKRLEDIPGFDCANHDCNFERELAFLQNAIETQNDLVYLHRQIKLPGDEMSARRAAESFMNGVLDEGGEGVVIRDGTSMWIPKRHRGVMKWKPFEDAEATIIGFVSGREGKQGNLLGKIGTLVFRTFGTAGEVEFEIGTGMNWLEREIDSLSDYEYACLHPGERLPDRVKGTHFEIGQTVTFKFREWTDDGIPKEARYWRQREEE